MYKSEKNRANCTAIADSLGELDHQSLNHLLSESPWDHHEVLDQLAHCTAEMFSGNQEVGLLIDEVGFRKKGKYSACVARQYLGCLGKQDNGQVAVVAGLSSGTYYSPINARLFMPEAWQEDHQRRRKAKIPEDIHHQTKPQMALEMINKTQQLGVRFDYVGFDALYGSSFELIKALDEDQISFIGDVKANIKMFISEPTFSIPEKQQGQSGRPFKHFQADQLDISLRQYQQSLYESDFEYLTFRDGTKQKIGAWYHQKEVWIGVDKQQGSSLRLQLIIRKDVDGTIKYSFCNMDQDTLIQIARRQGQRVFVERIFEEGKNQVGMGDYQVRSWAGFHKHLTLCFLAFYYMTSQKITYENELKLTAPVIRKLVAATIVSRWESFDDTILLCLNHIVRYQRQIKMNLARDSVT